MPLEIDNFSQSLPTEARPAINELSPMFLEDCRVSVLDDSNRRNNHQRNCRAPAKLECPRPLHRLRIASLSNLLLSSFRQPNATCHSNRLSQPRGPFFAVRYVITDRFPALQLIAIFSMGMPALVALMQVCLNKSQTQTLTGARDL
jgi:hypothetical protein